MYIFPCRSDPTENDSVEGLRPNARGPGLVTFGVRFPRQFSLFFYCIIGLSYVHLVPLDLYLWYRQYISLTLPLCIHTSAYMCVSVSPPFLFLGQRKLAPLPIRCCTAPFISSQGILLPQLFF